MNTDRELLELAAKAAEIQIQWHRWPSTARETAYVPNGDFSEQHGVCYSPWNPLTDDGDALRLAVKLNMGISIPVMAAPHARVDVITFRNSGVNVMESCNNDPYAATRRAIVRAAAEIGRNMKND